MRANLVNKQDFRHYRCWCSIAHYVHAKDQELKLLIYEGIAVCFLLLYLDSVFACICASKCSQRV